MEKISERLARSGPYNRSWIVIKYCVGWIIVLLMLLFLGGYLIYDKFFAVGDFSYQGYLMFIENDNSKRDSGFVNTTENPIKNRGDAIAQAKKEVNFDYANIRVEHDKEGKIWGVSFAPEDNTKMATVVYMYENGITFRIMDRN